MLVRVFKLVFLLFYDLREQSIDGLSITLSKQYVIIVHSDEETRYFLL